MLEYVCCRNSSRSELVNTACLKKIIYKIKSLFYSHSVDYVVMLCHGFLYLDPVQSMEPVLVQPTNLPKDQVTECVLDHATFCLPLACCSAPEVKLNTILMLQTLTLNYKRDQCLNVSRVALQEVTVINIYSIHTVLFLYSNGNLYCVFKQSKSVLVQDYILVKVYSCKKVIAAVLPLIAALPLFFHQQIF